MTRGEYLVGVDFNPSGNPEVAELKQAAAALIDYIERIPDGSDFPRECGRLKALARTAAEEAAMWGVKAITKPPVS